MSSRPSDRTSETDGSRTESDADWPSRSEGEMRAVVIYEQNARGAMTLRDDDTNATYQVVGYVSSDLQAAAGGLNCGTTVKVELVRIGCRANVWRVRTLTVPG